MDKPTLCVHCVKENITYSVAGKKLFRDQCQKCYDDSVSYIKYKTLLIYFIIKEMPKWFRYMFEMFQCFL